MEGGRWSQVVLHGPAGPRVGHSALRTKNGTVVLLGGSNGVSLQSDVWSSVDDGGSWIRALDRAAWGGRRGQALVEAKACLFLVGGSDQNDEVMSDVWASCDEGRRWHLLTASPGWAARRGHAAVVTQSESVLVLGGETAGGARLADVWRSQDGGGTWHQVAASASWPARSGHAAAILRGGAVVVLGGDAASDADVWRSDDDGASWARVTSRPAWGARWAHSATALETGELVVVGGTPDEKSGSGGWTSKDGGASWGEIGAPLQWEARAGHASVVLEGNEVLLMGGSNDASVFNDVWTTMDHGGSWLRVVKVAPWAPRASHGAAVLEGSNSLLIMGGHDPQARTVFNDVWRSIDGGRRWALVAEAAPWPARFAFASVVIGNGTVLVMGGCGSEQTGVAYNDVWASSDGGAAWAPISSTSPWAPRMGHAAVVMLNGSIVLIGGTALDNTLGDNARNVGEREGDKIVIIKPELPEADPDEASSFGDVWSSADGGASWTVLLPDAEWGPRNNHAAVILQNGTIVLSGGLARPSSWDVNVADDVWASDDGITWLKRGDELGWEARSMHAMLAVEANRVLLTGGLRRDGEYADDSWTSAELGASWLEVTGSSWWTPRMFHATVPLQDGALLLMGGEVHSREGGREISNDVWHSDDQGASWRQVAASAQWPSRHSFGAVKMHSDAVLVMGGRTDNGDVNDVWKSDDDGRSWHLISGAADWSARGSFCASVLPSGQVVVIGGMATGGVLQDVWSSPNAGLAWELLAETAPWSARQYSALAVLPTGVLVLAGGADATLQSFSDVWRSEDGGRSWNQSTASAAWTARLAHAMACDERGRLVLLGGLATNQQLMADVWESDDEGRTWSIVQPSAAFGGRAALGLVALTGDRFVLTGGVSSFDDFVANAEVWTSGDGGRLWTPTQVAKAAAFRPRLLPSIVELQNGDIFLGGGLDMRGLTGGLGGYRSRDGGLSWEPVHGQGAPTHFGSVIVSLKNGTLLLVGGVPLLPILRREQPPEFGETWLSTDEGLSWARVAANASWAPRYAHIVHVLEGDRVLLMGGLSFGKDGEQVSSDVWLSADGGTTWTLMKASAAWGPRIGFASAALPGDEIYVMGGEAESEARMREVWRSNDVGASWVLVSATAAWAPRMLPTVVGLQSGGLLVIGGDLSYQDGDSNGADSWISLDGGATWTELATHTPPRRRYAHATLLLKSGDILMTGGEDFTSDQTLGDSWILLIPPELRCPVGTARTDAQSGCVACEPGTHARQSEVISRMHSRVAVCDSCSPGTAASGFGATRCDACLAGTFAPSAGSAVCEPCAAGTYGSTNASTSDADCAPCLPGSFSRPGATECSVCPGDTFSSAPGSDACTSCPAGAFSPPGSTSASACIVCGPGTYLDNGTCAACASGTFNPNEGALSRTACYPCPIGSESAAGSPQCVVPELASDCDLLGDRRVQIAAAANAAVVLGLGQMALRRSLRLRSKRSVARRPPPVESREDRGRVQPRPQPQPPQPPQPQPQPPQPPLEPAAPSSPPGPSGDGELRRKRRKSKRRNSSRRSLRALSEAELPSMV